MSFARTLSDVSNGDGSLGRTLNENSQNSISNNSFAPPLFFSGLKTKYDLILYNFKERLLEPLRTNRSPLLVRKW